MAEDRAAESLIKSAIYGPVFGTLFLGTSIFFFIQGRRQERRLRDIKGQDKVYTVEDLRRIRSDRTGEDERVVKGMKNCLIEGMLVHEKYTDKSNKERKQIKDLKKHIKNERESKVMTVYGD